MAQSRPVSPVITALLATFSEYVRQQAADPTATDPRGAAVQQVIQHYVARYGDEDEQSDLQSYERNPARYEEFMGYVLSDLAARNPDFAHEMEAVARTHSIADGTIPTGRQPRA